MRNPKNVIKGKWDNKLANGTTLSHKGHDTAAKCTFLTLRKHHNTLKLEANIGENTEIYFTDFGFRCENSLTHKAARQNPRQIWTKKHMSMYRYEQRCTLACNKILTTKDITVTHKHAVRYEGHHRYKQRSTLVSNKIRKTKDITDTNKEAH